MRRIRVLSVVFVLLFSLASLTLPAYADDDFKGDKPPSCKDMPDAQIPGQPAGSACRVPIVSRQGDAAPTTLYRSGWTNTYTSESDSDLTENQIKVEGYLYWYVGGQWYFDDSCVDDNTWASHAACRTYGGGSENRQDGYHYFHTTGYGDSEFETQDYWS